MKKALVFFTLVLSSQAFAAFTVCSLNRMADSKNSSSSQTVDGSEMIVALDRNAYLVKTVDGVTFRLNYQAESPQGDEDSGYLKTSAIVGGPNHGTYSMGRLKLSELTGVFSKSELKTDTFEPESKEANLERIRIDVRCRQMSAEEAITRAFNASHKKSEI